MFDFTDLAETRLSRGQHPTAEGGMCLMEMAAWFAGEPHSMVPACVCPALRHHEMIIDDAIDGIDRDNCSGPL